MDDWGYVLYDAEKDQFVCTDVRLRSDASCPDATLANRYDEAALEDLYNSSGPFQRDIISNLFVVVYDCSGGFRTDFSTAVQFRHFLVWYLMSREGSLVTV